MVDQETALKQAVELLKGTLHTLRRCRDSSYVLNVLHELQPANGGGDGYCLMEEIEDFFACEMEDSIPVDHLGTTKAHRKLLTDCEHAHA